MEVSQELIDRHAKFRLDIKSISDSISRGEFWTERSPGFDAVLTDKGYENIGTYNYLPSVKGMDSEPEEQKWDQAWKAYCDAMLTLEATGFENPLFEINSRQYNKNNITCLANLYTLERLKFAGIKPKKYLEIGGGSGLLAGFMHETFNSQIFIVDLPEMLTVSSAFLMYTFPDKRFLLSNEIDGSIDFDGYDFVLVTPAQTQLLPDTYFDLAVNKASFMEMNQNEVDNYFHLVNRCLHEEGYFYCSNRPVKRTIFFDYLWEQQKNYRDIFYELNRFRRNFPNEFIDRCRVKEKNGSLAAREMPAETIFLRFYRLIRNYFWKKEFQVKFPALAVVRNKLFDLLIEVPQQ